MSKARELADSADNNLDSIVADSSGNVGIGTTTPTTALAVNRNSTYGYIQSFKYNDAVVGGIRYGTDNGNTITGMIYGNDSNGAVIFANNDAVLAPMTDGTLDLGKSVNRFKDLYLSGGVYLGGTGSANYLDDYEEGTFTPVMTGVTGWSGSSGVSGKYTKIGNTVHVFIVMTSNASLTGTASNVISGLPFSTDLAERCANVSVSRMYGIGLTTTDYIAGVVGSELYFSYVNGANNTNNFTHSGSTLRLTISATYRTAS